MKLKRIIALSLSAAALALVPDRMRRLEQRLPIMRTGIRQQFRRDRNRKARRSRRIYEDLWAPGEGEAR